MAYFSPSAEGSLRGEGRSVRERSVRAPRLVDLKRLFDLWIEHYAKVPEEFRQLLPLKPVYFLAPQD